MYKRIDFTLLEGLGFTQDTLDFLQTSYREALASVASLFGDYVIISGVNVAGSNYTDGWVAINGELLPFTGGLIAANIIIEETSANELFADGSNKAVYFTRRAKLASSGGTAFSSFVRLTTIKYLTQQIDLKSTINSPAFTGTPTAPTGAPGTNTNQIATTAFVKALGDLKANLNSPSFTGVPSAPTPAPGTNTNQLATTSYVIAAINALIAASPGALDTLNELAAALGNDPNFATTITNALAGKVAKSGDTMTGILTNTAGFRTDATQPALLKRIIPIGDWNMDADVTVVLSHGIANYKKIRTYSAIIRDDADLGYHNISRTGIDGQNTIQGMVRGINLANTSQIVISRATGGFFDSADFDGTSYNRGWVTIEYEA